MSEFSGKVIGLLPTLFDHESSQERLTKVLSDIDDRLKWEAGPYERDQAYLALSPNLDPELLPLTELLISSLPAVPGWVFLDAKPRKTWTSRSVDYLGRKYSFDDWRYRLTSFRGGEFFDIHFFGCESDLPEDVRDWLALFLATSELGERLFIAAVDRVSALPNDMEEGPTIEVAHLYDQVSSLLLSPASSQSSGERTLS